MGNRLHFETKHVIEYSDEEAFNWGQEIVAKLLSKYEVQMFTDESSEGYYANNFYCPREEIASMVNALRKRKPNAKCLAIDGEDYTNKAVADFFTAALANADTHNNGYIYFAWF